MHHELSGDLRAGGRVGIVVSRYHERITAKLLAGAMDCLRQAGIDDPAVEVLWVPGAFELVVATEAAAASERYAAMVALGVVVRGETPHFDYVAAAAAHGLADVARTNRIPVGFGLLTVDTIEQAVDRAGGRHGNKGFEAAEAAVRTADLLARLRALDAPG